MAEEGVRAAIVSEELKMEDRRRKHLKPIPKEPEPTTSQDLVPEPPGAFDKTDPEGFIKKC